MENLIPKNSGGSSQEIQGGGYRLLRHWRRIGDPRGGYRAEGFGLFDAEGRLHGWTLHWGDAMQLAQFMPGPKPAPRLSAGPTPQFAMNERVATGFGCGQVTEMRWKAPAAGWAHWRYIIRMDDGALVDAAESGVRGQADKISKISA